MVEAAVPRAQVLFLLALALYCFSNLCLRVLVSPAVGFDEAEMLLSGQVWAWGYGAQPPLYVWIQKGAFALFGVSVFSLALVKNLLLFGLYFLTFQLSREVLDELYPAILATAALFLVPALGWEALRSQTHNVLATAVAAAFLWVALRVLRDGSLEKYLAWGAVAALGILSKYNFGVLLLGTAAALIFSEQGRERLFNWRSLVAALVAAALAGPHLLWLAANPGWIGELRSKLDSEGAAGGVAWSGPADLAMALLSFVGLVLVVFLIQFGPRIFRGFLREGEGEGFSASGFLRRIFASEIVILVIVTLAASAEQFKDRWLEPILFFLPILLVAGVKDLVGGMQLRRMASVAAVAALGALAILYGRVVLTDAIDRRLPLNFPSVSLAEQLREGGFDRGVIVAQRQETAGSLKVAFPDSTVLTPDRPLPVSEVSKRLLVCWDPTVSRTLPAETARFLARQFGVETEGRSPRTIRAPYLYSREAMASLAYLLIER